jgi:Coenzyme PQQ synthesis protein D (PqqD)
MPTGYHVNTPPVIHQTLDGEVIVVNLDSGTYYSLQGTGAEIWSALEAGATLQETVERLLGRYEGEPADVERAVGRFVDELVQEELVAPTARERPHDEAAGAAADGAARTTFEQPVLNRYTDMQELLMLDPIHEVDEQGWPHGLEPEATAAEG